MGWRTLGGSWFWCGARVGRWICAVVCVPWPFAFCVIGIFLPWGCMRPRSCPFRDADRLGVTIVWSGYGNGCTCPRPRFALLCA